jgi:hypothetical protein
MSSIYYGHIVLELNETSQMNAQKVLDDLPENGQYCIKEIFHLVPYSRSHAYYGAMITFSWHLKGSYCIDEELIKEFELLLTLLEWSSAEMIVTWSGTVIKWGRLRDKNAMNYLAPNQFARSFYGSMWDLSELDEGSVL